MVMKRRPIKKSEEDKYNPYNNNEATGLEKLNMSQDRTPSPENGV
jgi:hypothetical protein